jgi:hypothetical protein
MLCRRLSEIRKLFAVGVIASLIGCCPDLVAARQRMANSPSNSVNLNQQIEPLAYFTGHWSCEGVFPSSGKTIASQIIFAPDLEGAWLTVRHDDAPPNRYHAYEMWGFDPQSKVFVAYIYDNFGGVRKFTSPGWSDTEFTWMGEASKSDPPTSERFVFKRDGPSQFVTSYEVKRGSGSWATGDKLTCQK